MKPWAPQGQLWTRGPSAQQQRCVGELAATPKDPGPGRVCAEDGAGKRNGVRGAGKLVAQGPEQKQRPQPPALPSLCLVCHAGAPPLSAVLLSEQTP